MFLLFQSVTEFLKTLPSYDKNNFSRFHTDSTNRTCVKRPSVYISTEEIPSEQSKYFQVNVVLYLPVF